jgi:hypothetical protein
MLKKILIAVAAIIAVFLVVVALQPSEFKVERSATISAPPAAVFEQVNDFHKWEAVVTLGEARSKRQGKLRGAAGRNGNHHDLVGRQPSRRGENDAHRESAERTRQGQR